MEIETKPTKHAKRDFKGKESLIITSLLTSRIDINWSLSLMGCPVSIVAYNILKPQIVSFSFQSHFVHYSYHVRLEDDIPKTKNEALEDLSESSCFLPSKDDRLSRCKR